MRRGLPSSQVAAERIPSIQTTKYKMNLIFIYLFIFSGKFSNPNSGRSYLFIFFFSQILLVSPIIVVSDILCIFKFSLIMINGSDVHI